MGILRRLLRELALADHRTGGSAPAVSTDAPLNPGTLDEIADEARAARAVLADAYSRYVAAVSSEDMAISMETASFLFALCRRIRPSRILDLGSGFSSFAFRAYAHTTDRRCLVHTVDDDEAWLERTRDFVSREDLAPDGLFAWAQFEEALLSDYTLVLHDLGRMPRRSTTVEFAVTCLAPNGVLVLDDMHKPHYASQAEAVCARAGLRVFSLRSYTLDRFGRFACLALSATPTVT